MEDELKDERRAWVVEYMERRDFKEVPPIEKFYDRDAENRVLS